MRYWVIALGAGEVIQGYEIVLPPQATRQFVGGTGIASFVLHSSMAERLPNNFTFHGPIVLSFSPLVGTPLTTSAKFAVVARSPLTGRLNDSLSSSHFAIAGKKTGFDAFVITGRCPRPSVLVIDDEKVTLEPADDLLGLTTSEAQQKLGERLGPSFQLAVIGPAGENGVRYATLSHGNRHAGRGGHGAVLGAKNLKAVAVRGTKRVEVADPAGVAAYAKELSKRSFGPATAKYRELGTVSNLLTFNRLNALPTRNFQQGTFEGAEAVSGEALNASRKMARESCAACTIGCEHIYQAADGSGVRLEYESLFALGPLCGIADKDAVIRAAQLCDGLGLDTISAGATVAFAMECVQRGLLDVPWLTFGSSEALLRVLPMIAYREGIGDLLAEGTRIAAARIGGDAPDFAPHVKGLEIPGYEPRALQTMALGFAVGSRGADHNRSGAYEIDFSTKADRYHGTPEAARLAVETEDRAALMDSLILCKFLRGVLTDFWGECAHMLNLVTGWDTTPEELKKTAKRIVTAKKLLNMRWGWTRAEDTLPKRFLSEGLPAGMSPGAALPRERLDAMIAAYYAERGWDAEGRPTPETIRELGLEEFATAP
jgi:aldehyde:ferredoxin oxidoreductase